MFGRITLVTSAAFAGSFLASISAYAADKLGDVVYVELPLGENVTANLVGLGRGDAVAVG